MKRFILNNVLVIEKDLTQMKYNLISSLNKKLGIFTDIHFGIGKDSQYRLKETEKCIDWIIKTFKSQRGRLCSILWRFI